MMLKNKFPNIAMKRSGLSRKHSGASLIVVLMMLTIIFSMGVIAAKLSIFSERSGRNDRDRQLAFQSAEAALLDAEIDMMGPNALVGNRVCNFDSKKPAEFVEGCGTGTKTGMCLNTANSSFAWKNVLSQYSSETGTTNSNKTVQYGQFTGQTMSTGNSGQSIRPPRYTIEAVRYTGTGAADDNVGSSSGPEYAFLVTAMGFGTKLETQVLLQALVYKPANKPNSGC